MSDGPSFAFGPFGPMELTEEQREEIKRQRDLQNMRHEEGQRLVNDFIESLDAEKLETFKNIVIQTMGDEKDSYATHMLGWLNARLYYEFGICMACGKKHEDITVIEGEPSG